MKRYIKSNKILWPWRMVGEYDSGTIREVAGNSEAECIEDLANWGDDMEGSTLVNYYGVNDNYYVDGELVLEDTY